jgi:hypothetical protein
MDATIAKLQKAKQGPEQAQEGDQAAALAAGAERPEAGLRPRGKTQPPAQIEGPPSGESAAADDVQVVHHFSFHKSGASPCSISFAYALPCPDTDSGGI